MNLSTFQYIFSSIFKNIRRKEENGENEVTFNDISQSVDFIFLRILTVKDAMSSPFLKFITSHDILKTMEEYFLWPLWRKLGGACEQPVNQTPSRCKGHVTILRTN